MILKIFEHAEYREDVTFCASPGLDWAQLDGCSVLITGATGLVGSLLVDALMHRNSTEGSDISVYILVRNEAAARERFAPYVGNLLFHLLVQDINDPLCSDVAFDFIIHAASNTHPVAYAGDPIGTVTTNIIGTNNLLQYAAIHGSKRVVFLSTVEIYGEPVGDTVGFSEGDCGYIDCNSLRGGYPESKRAGEALCNAYNKQYGIDFVIPRLCRIYGPTMLPSDSKAIAQFLRKGVAGEDIVMKSPGEQYFSFCYVADCVRAVLFTLLHGKSCEAYNIADVASNIRLKDLATLIAVTAGRKIVFDLPSVTEAAGFSKVQTAILNCEKINALGWQANYNIASGVERTLRILKAAT